MENKKEKSIEWKKKKYLQACRIMDLFNSKTNLCEIRTENEKVTCNGTRFLIEDGLCCLGCTHLGKKGCTTKSLMCKLSYCYIGNSPACSKLVEKHSNIQKKYKNITYTIYRFFCNNNIPLIKGRASMEDTFMYYLEPNKRHTFNNITAKFED